jgi:hypothetical protein
MQARISEPGNAARPTTSPRSGAGRPTQPLHVTPPRPFQRPRRETQVFGPLDEETKR